MLENIQKITNQLLTGRDNATHDILRWLGLLGFISYITLTFYSVIYLGVVFNYQEFSTGLAAMFGGLGAGLGLKSQTEPQ